SPAAVPRSPVQVGGMPRAAVSTVVHAPLAVSTIPEVAPRVTNSVGMTLVRIEPGSFLRGSPDSGPDAEAHEKRQHRVTIRKAFYLTETELTQGQYQKVTGRNPSRFKGADTLPVEYVSWFDAVQFCNALSQKDGLAPFYR